VRRVDYASELGFALELADLADGISLDYFRRLGGLRVERKPDASPVTEADTRIEQRLRERIGAAWPADAAVGEEFGASGERARRRWIIDPIDGTRKFVRGLPGFATLLALEDAGEMVVGVVSAPALGRRWWAARGQGAFADDGRPVRVSGVAELGEAHLLHGGIEGFVRTGRLAGLAALAVRGWATAGYGDFWIHALVAEGAAEAAFEAEVALWDVAAVQVIVEEAGGRFTDLRGRPTAAGGSALSSNGRLHDEVLRVLSAEC
jgi:histidinol-phosphatase